LIKEVNLLETAHDSHTVEMLSVRNRGIGGKPEHQKIEITLFPK